VTAGNGTKKTHKPHSNQLVEAGREDGLGARAQGIIASQLLLEGVNGHRRDARSLQMSHGLNFKKIAPGNNLLLRRFYAQSSSKSSSSAAWAGDPATSS
jgi:hypothetical protein